MTRGSSRRVVIVGGGPAAHAAAQGYRDAGGLGSVTLLSDDDRPPYERPPLSKGMLRGEADAEQPLAEAGWYDRAGVQVRTGAVATAVDRVARLVRLRDDAAEPYDALILATGGQPVRPELPGVEHSHVHLLRTARNAVRLRDAVQAGTHVVVVGTGFIGCEAAASLARRGAHVTLAGLEDAPLAARIGTDAGERVGAWLDAEGVQRRHGAGLDAVEEGSCTIAGDAVRADVVLLVTGIERRTGLAADSGLEADEDGIVAGVGQSTRDPLVRACGDCAQTFHPHADRVLPVEHWGDALAQGEVAGRRIAGDARARWEAVPGFWSQIGDRLLKHSAWGDGWADTTIVDHPGGGWTVWYADEHGCCVGVLTHDADADWERGRALVADGRPAPGAG